MQDIGQMRFDTPPGDKQPQRKAGGKHTVILAVFAAAVCVILVVLAILLFQSQKSGNEDNQVAPDEQVQMHVREEIEMLNQAIHGMIGIDDIRWEDYYPDAVADQIYADMAEGYMDDPEPMDITIEVLSVSEIDPVCVAARMQDAARNFFEYYEIAFAENTFHVEEGYLAFCTISDEDEAENSIFLILKADGKYGIYGAYEDITV